jgi:hypothetical protein
MLYKRLAPRRRAKNALHYGKISRMQFIHVLPGFFQAVHDRQLGSGWVVVVGRLRQINVIIGVQKQIAA